MLNSHMVYVKYLGPTNTRGARVQLSCYDVQKHDNRDKAKKITVGYEYAADTYKQAEAMFKAAGLKVIAMNDRHPENITYVLKWDIERLRAIFGMKEK